MNPYLTDQLYGYLRHVLSGLAVGLVVHGYMTTDQSNQVVPVLAQLLTGGVMFLGACVASRLQKKFSRQKLLVALASPTPTTEAAVAAHIAMDLPVPALTTPVNAVPVPIK